MLTTITFVLAVFALYLASARHARARRDQERWMTIRLSRSLTPAGGRSDAPLFRTREA